LATKAGYMDVGAIPDRNSMMSSKEKRLSALSSNQGMADVEGGVLAPDFDSQWMNNNSPQPLQNIYVKN